MISDKERRAVAARMREIMRDDPHGWLDIMVAKATCNDVGDDWEFHCSACGCELDIREMEVGEPTMWKDGAAQVPKYCPSCGAEVVSND